MLQAAPFHDVLTRCRVLLALTLPTIAYAKAPIKPPSHRHPMVMALNLA
jgi:hypothetical protein